ncbi:MAG TPA: lipopolysaccharide heptosyltransferase I [Casimicrobiaceae bacterium]|nr:lipopolysaccharide heptosyltransferase I [Casimicrobiaceae bacterium]
MQTHSQAIGSAPSLLVVRPSSLGDIVHALPLVHDVRERHPGAAIDWVAEESFVDLVRMNRGVRHVIPVALRRWRHALLERSTWREFARFRHDVAAVRYDAVLDLQEQVKGALVAALARGPVHGPDRRSVREPIVTALYRHRHRVDPDQHLIDRCRWLAAAAFGYEPRGAPHFDLAPPLDGDPPDAPYVVFLHATSRRDKLWPEAHWQALAEHVLNAGFAVVLPWGTAAEKLTSERIAHGSACIVPGARRSLPELASLLARAVWVVGVDTGLTHLAAALGTPTVALFTATDARLAGVARASPVARDLGGVGMVPRPDQVIAATAPLLRTVPSS